MIKVFEVYGNEYEMGCQIGKKFKLYLAQKINTYEKVINENKDIYEKVKDMEEKLKKTYPKCLDEIYGRADGAEVPRDAMLLMFFPEIFKQIDGCTTVILKKNNNSVLFAHNEDDRNYNIENVAIVKYDYEDYWIVGYTMAEKLTGSSFAYNSYGIVFSSNYIYDIKIDLNNISRYIMVRDVMNSKSIEEVIYKMKNSKVASAFSLNVLDVNSNKVINIEKDIKDVYITDITDRYARSNHFICKKDNLPNEPISSKFRYNKSKELLQMLNNTDSNIDDLVNILKYETDDYLESTYKNPEKYNDKSVTVSTFCIDSESKEITIYDYLGKSRLNFKYNEFDIKNM